MLAPWHELAKLRDAARQCREEAAFLSPRASTGFRRAAEELDAAVTAVLRSLPSGAFDGRVHFDVI